jgi:hypothetical protein
MGDPPVEYIWHDGPLPAGLPVDHPATAGYQD